MHFKDRWLLPIYLVGRKIQPGLIGKTKRRSSSRFRAELVSGGTCSSENCPRSEFPPEGRNAFGKLVFSPCTDISRHRGGGCQELLETGKQTGVKTGVEVEAAPVSIGRCMMNKLWSVRTMGLFIIPS